MVEVEFRKGSTPYDDNRRLSYPIECLDLLVGDPDVIKIIRNDAGKEKVLFSR